VRLHILSDLHLEFEQFEMPAVDADVLVLAGDVALGTGGADYARERAAGRPVIYVAGNHEYYGHSFPDLNAEIEAATDGSSVHFLENREVMVAGVRFLGCALWTDFAAGAATVEESMGASAVFLNDYRQIRRGSSSDALQPVDTLRAHQESRAWLAANLATPYPGPTVVVTHHQPVPWASPPSSDGWLDGAFVNEMEDFLDGDRVAVWIAGHTHWCFSRRVNGTRLISNQRGYPHESTRFDPALVVDV
jgi:Calcineurin-like phosphoesterase